MRRNQGGEKLGSNTAQVGAQPGVHGLCRFLAAPLRTFTQPLSLICKAGWEPHLIAGLLGKSSVLITVNG